MHTKQWRYDTVSVLFNITLIVAISIDRDSGWLV